MRGLASSKFGKGGDYGGMGRVEGLRDSDPFLPGDLIGEGCVWCGGGVG